MARYIHLPLLALSLILAPQVHGQGSEGLPYSHTYDWTSRPMGFHSTGLALADINGDSFEDMVVSNGNDLGIQSLAVYYNNGRGSFRLIPDWLSDDQDFHGMLTVGDINGDGWVDVAVAVLMDHQMTDGTGGVKVYLNRGGTLEKRPSYRTADSYFAVSCALGDADADGDLDLAVAVVQEGDQNPGFQRIYYNRRGSLSRHPGWKSLEREMGLSVKFADVQGDGLLDLVVGAQEVQIYTARFEGFWKVTLPQTPSWRSRKGLPVFYLDVGPLGTGRTPGIIAARNPLMEFPRVTEAHFEAYLPLVGTEPVWSSSSTGFNSGVLLADVNKDGVLDLLAGRWGERLTDGAPLEIYLGSAAAFGTEPAFISENRSMIEAISVADLRHKGPSTEVTSIFEPTRPIAVVTLPEQHVRRIVEVRRNGVPLWRRMYTSVPGGRWLSFSVPVYPGERIEVRHVPVSVHDIVFANADCNLGNYIYYDYGDSPESVPTPSTDEARTHRERVPARGRLAPIKGERSCW